MVPSLSVDPCAEKETGSAASPVVTSVSMTALGATFEGGGGGGGETELPPPPPQAVVRIESANAPRLALRRSAGRLNDENKTDMQCPPLDKSKPHRNAERHGGIPPFETKIFKPMGECPHASAALLPLGTEAPDREPDHANASGD